MKYLKLLILLLAVLCFVEVYIIYAMLSFIDYPYLYLGSGLLFIFLLIHIKRKK